jgi:hypothetical protein
LRRRHGKLVWSTVSDSKAQTLDTTQGRAFGGGIYANILVAQYSSISGNVVSSNNFDTAGGGVAISGISTGGASTIENSTINNNQASTSAAYGSSAGGLLEVGSAGTLSISNSTISGKYSVSWRRTLNGVAEQQNNALQQYDRVQSRGGGRRRMGVVRRSRRSRGRHSCEQRRRVRKCPV